MNWQPIASAPKDGTRVKVKFADGSTGEASYQTTYGGEWHVKSYRHVPWAKPPIEWLPLPPPPSVEDGE